VGTSDERCTRVCVCVERVEWVRVWGSTCAGARYEYPFFTCLTQGKWELDCAQGLLRFDGGGGEVVCTYGALGFLFWSCTLATYGYG
jgi:hypothetical protein